MSLSGVTGPPVPPPATELGGDPFFSTLRARAGTILFAPGGWGRQVLLVRSGRVRLFQREPGGREMTLAHLGPGRMLGVADIYGQAGDGPYAEAETELVAGVAAGAAFARAVVDRPALLRAVLEQLAAAIVEADELFVELGVADGRERLLRFLRRRARQCGTSVEGGWLLSDLPHQAGLGRQVGLSRETVARLLGRLDAEGAIRRDGRAMIVLA